MDGQKTRSCLNLPTKVSYKNNFFIKRYTDNVHHIHIDENHHCSIAVYPRRHPNGLIQTIFQRNVNIVIFVEFIICL